MIVTRIEMRMMRWRLTTIMMTINIVRTKLTRMIGIMITMTFADEGADSGHHEVR